MTRLILASASSQRLLLLRQLGIAPDEVITPRIDETPLKDELPEPYARRMAIEKARAVAGAGIITLAADTVIACGRRILPKAENEEQARRCLALLSGRRHRAVTAVAAIDRQGKERTLSTITQVRFKRLSHEEMETYIQGGEWRGKAGGYAIQGQAAAFIPSINGSHSNVVGLPLYETMQLLRALNVL